MPIVKVKLSAINLNKIFNKAPKFQQQFLDSDEVLV